MRFRDLILPVCFLALAVPARAQVFADAFNAKRDNWEVRLKQGEAQTVRQEIETFLSAQGASISPSNYGDQHAIVGARGMEARACVALGDWESAIDFLKKAAATAGDNLTATEASFDKLRADHDAKLKQWKDELADSQTRLDQLNAAPGLTEDQMKLKGQLQTYVSEHQASIQHSQDSLKAMDGALTALRQEKADYDKSSTDWQAFLAKEKDDIAAAGSVKVYVTQKTAQVKADDLKSTDERLSYVRRLLTLDTGNPDALRLEAALRGKVQPDAPAPKPPTHRRKGH